MSEQQKDTSGYTGDRARYAETQRAWEQALDGATDPNVRAVALAVRAGLAEIAVVLDSIRGFGVGQAPKK